MLAVPTPALGDNALDTTITPANVSTLTAKFAASDGTSASEAPQAVVNGILYAAEPSAVNAYSANGTTGCSGSPTMRTAVDLRHRFHDWNDQRGEWDALRRRWSGSPSLRRQRADRLLGDPDSLPTRVGGHGEPPPTESNGLQRECVCDDSGR